MINYIANAQCFEHIIVSSLNTCINLFGMFILVSFVYFVLCLEVSVFMLYAYLLASILVFKMLLCMCECIITMMLLAEKASP